MTKYQKNKLFFNIERIITSIVVTVLFALAIHCFSSCATTVELPRKYDCPFQTNKTQKYNAFKNRT